MIRATVMAAVLLAASQAARATELSIMITGLRSAKGSVHVGLYGDPETFPKGGQGVAGARVAVHKKVARAVFNGLEPGEYAVVVFHDENDNGKFDRWIFGVPVEGYGFSRDAPVKLEPPKFEDAFVQVPPEGADIVIRMRY